MLYIEYFRFVIDRAVCVFYIIDEEDDLCEINYKDLEREYPDSSKKTEVFYGDVSRFVWEKILFLQKKDKTTDYE